MNMTQTDRRRHHAGTIYKTGTECSCTGKTGMIHYYLESDGKREGLKGREFYRKAGLTENECRIYQNMEKNFQKYMLGNHNSMLSLYPKISPGKADAVQFYEEKKFEEAQMLQVFWDTGSDFTEENSKKYPVKNKRISAGISFPEHTRRLRLDPLRSPHIRSHRTRSPVTWA